MRCLSESFKYKTATFPMGRKASKTLYSNLQNCALYTNHSGPMDFFREDSTTSTFTFSLKLLLPQHLHRLLSLSFTYWTHSFCSWESCPDPLVWIQHASILQVLLYCHSNSYLLSPGRVIKLVMGLLSPLLCENWLSWIYLVRKH